MVKNSKSIFFCWSEIVKVIWFILVIRLWNDVLLLWGNFEEIWIEFEYRMIVIKFFISLIVLCYRFVNILSGWKIVFEIVVGWIGFFVNNFNE